MELVVVIAILGVLAAITVPMVNNFLGSSKAQAYNLEKERIQDAVNQYRLNATSTRFWDNASTLSTTDSKPGENSFNLTRMTQPIRYW